MDGECRTYGRDEKSCRIFGGKSEGKKPLRRPWRRWENVKTNIKMEGAKMWIGFRWLRVWFSGRLLRTR